LTVGLFDVTDPFSNRQIIVANKGVVVIRFLYDVRNYKIP